MENKVKKISTIWLDFIIYIFMPFYFLALSIETINFFGSKSILYIILLLLCLIYTIITFYNLIKRNKISYYLSFIFIVISMITSVLYFSNKVNITNIIYILEFMAAGLVLWIVPNFIYLYKRKDIFREHNIAHIKKCPGCNRIIPVHMEYCGKCNYKETKNE